MFFASLVVAQTTYDSDFVCLDSADGITFWGVTDSTDVKLLKFTLVVDVIFILESIDLADTLIYKQVVVFSEERVGISTETNTYVYYDGYQIPDFAYCNLSPVYYNLSTPIREIKKCDSSSMYVLYSSGVIELAFYDFRTRNQFCSQNNTVVTISCFDIRLGAPIQLICGGYEVLNNDMAGQISIFDELQYYSVPIISCAYGQYSEISKVINDESGVFFIAKENMAPPYGWGAFSLIKINQSTNFSEELLVQMPTHYFAPMFLVKNGNSIYFAMGTAVARYDLDTTGMGWQSVLNTPYGDIAKNMFIAGNKLIASFEHSSDYGYFVVLDIQGVSIDDNTIASPEIVMSNYPNPFRGETKISFSLPKTEDVKLEIYNIKGQLVRTLINGQKSAGANNVVWDGSDDNGNEVTKGVYFYKIRCGSYSVTKKMIFMK